MLLIILGEGGKMILFQQIIPSLIVISKNELQSLPESFTELCSTA